MLAADTVTNVLIAGSLASGGYVLLRRFFEGGDEKVRSRLTAQDPRHAAAATSDWRQFIEQASDTLAKPFMPQKRERLAAMRRGLQRAGMYQPVALRVYLSAKLVLLSAGLLGGLLAGQWIGMVMLGVSAGAIAGYLLPTMWLKSRTKEHQNLLSLGLADALDLMVVCIEAGLTIDAAMQRVARELSAVHPRLARELEVVHLESRVGVPRPDALRNLGSRTGSGELQSLASVLIQAERFGTSIAHTLRVHGESLRSRRRIAAEEMAAKASVKMTLPLVLCILPATFILLAGPTVLALLNSALFQE